MVHHLKGKNNANTTNRNQGDLLNKLEWLFTQLEPLSDSRKKHNMLFYYYFNSIYEVSVK